MGKGDKKTKKGKIALGSFGKSRPKKSSATVEVASAAPAAKKKAAAKK